MLKLKKGDSIGIFSPSYPITYTAPKRFKIVEGNLTGKHDCKK
jgi:muramoyltetrapeptide carboxypeptidase